LATAQDSGNRSNESHLAVALFRLEAEQGDVLAALDYAMLSIRNYHDSDNTNTIFMPWRSFLDRHGRHEPAATIAGFAFNTLTATSFSGVPTRSPTCARFWATRPTSRSPAQARR
jgi:hypothetical protein